MAGFPFVVSFEYPPTDNGVVGHISSHWLTKSQAKASRSWRTSPSMVVTFGRDLPSLIVTSANCFSKRFRPGMAKILRLIEATISWDPFSTTAKVLRVKWTSYRGRHHGPVISANPHLGRRSHRLLQPGARVGRDQLHPAQFADLHRAQECS